MIDIPEFHKEVLGGMQIPEFFKELTCLKCNEKLPITALREIGMRFNAKDIGNVVVGYFCPNCGTMSNAHYEKAVEDVPDFIAILNGQHDELGNPKNEQENFFKKENNLLDKILDADRK